MIHRILARLFAQIGRGLLAPGLIVFACFGPAAAVELPKEPDAVIAQIREAIETRNYDMLKDLVFWKDAGKIKKRIVRYHLNQNLGRSIKSISWETFPEGGMNAAIATGKLMPNMEVTHQVRVIFDEAPINAAGKLPTSVFLVGKRKDVYRIALVVRSGVDDDGD